MKTSKVTLTKWQPQDTEYIDIDWPRVHKDLGSDQVNWFLRQPRNCCQLFLEQSTEYFKLVAEFYDSKTWETYHLMWAK